MTTFLRLLADKDKATGLLETCMALRTNADELRVFEVAPRSFRAVPGAPFAYWISEAMRSVFTNQPSFESDKRTARQGLATAEDFRFVRTWWEEPGHGWYGFAKGGVFSPYYLDVHLMAKWAHDGSEIKAGICRRYPYLNGNAEFVAKNPQFYFRPGLTWPRRTKSRLSMRIMPQGCIFADKGPAILVFGDLEGTLFSLLAICSSDAFYKLVEVQLAAADAQPGGAAHSFEIGVIQKTPVSDLSPVQQATLAALARRAWWLKRTLDTIGETSHSFLLPAALRVRLSDYYDPPAIEAELARIQSEIDAVVFDLYGFGDADHAAVPASTGNEMQVATEDSEATDNDADDEVSTAPIDQTMGLLSWATGVAFGRFDWRLATGERAAPPELEPCDPLPAKSPGMLPDGIQPFHSHAGILVDDPGHRHDLPHLIETILDRIGTNADVEIRAWLRRTFFPLHLNWTLATQAA